MLSAHEDLFDLVLVRWKKYEEWSPWNCILLTKEEASAHAKLENVTEVVHAIVILLLFFYCRFCYDLVKQRNGSRRWIANLAIAERKLKKM